MPTRPSPVTVIHLLDAAGGDGQLWGKERVAHWLMEAQLASGEVLPLLRTLTPKLLNEVAGRSGIDSQAIAQTVTKDPRPYVAGLRKALDQQPGALVHTHGYKANLIGRAAKWAGVKMGGLISTCHGWVETTRSLRVYNALDRFTSRYSDAATVPAPNMQERMPRGTIFLPNGIPDAPVPTPEEEQALRAKLRIPSGAIVAGTLGRLSAEKGIDVLIDAVRQTSSVPNLVWIVAGTGPLADDLKRAETELPNLRFIGYVEGSEGLLPAIDVFVQPSWTEGLSLALLEAARAQRAIVATRVGATDWAIRPQQEGLLVQKGDGTKLAEEVTRLAADEELRRDLGHAARHRFEDALNIHAMHRRLLEVYQQVLTRNSPLSIAQKADARD
ncbi:glycosyltransferase family 4 protein [bacterium]|nr:glycosyltransferase family 4 protein [bacterium]